MTGGPQTVVKELYSFIEVARRPGRPVFEENVRPVGDPMEKLHVIVLSKSCVSSTSAIHHARAHQPASAELPMS